MTRHQIGKTRGRRQSPGQVGIGLGLLADLADPDTTPDPTWDEEFNAGVLRAAIEQIRPCFEPATWKAFERSWLDDCPPAAVAEELGVPIDSVYVARSRVLKRLRERILEIAEDHPKLVPLA